MYVKIKEIKDALEAAYMRSVLNEENIPYNIAEYTDSAYKGFLETKYGFGILEAPEELKEKILELLQDEKLTEEQINYKTDEQYIKKTPDRTDASSKLIIGLLIVSTFFFALLYFKKNNELNHINKNGIFTYEWNDKTSSTLTKWKKDGKLDFIHVDNNRNYIAEKTFAYDLDGNIMEEAYDVNENGIFEKRIIYNVDGRISDIYYDLDDNYALDKTESKINDNLSMFFEDKNNDKIWDSVSFMDANGINMKSMTYTEYENFLIELSKNQILQDKK